MFTSVPAPPDPEEWSRLADMSLEHGDIPQACICYKKAIIADPPNARYLLYMEEYRQG